MFDVFVGFLVRLFRTLHTNNRKKRIPRINLRLEYLEPRLAPAASLFGGMSIAAGDLNNDGYTDLVTGAGPGAGPHIKAFSGKTGGELFSFYAYAKEFVGGVRVAVGDVNNDGFDDIIAGSGKGATAHLIVFSGKDGGVLHSFLITNAPATGISVAAGDVNGDGCADMVVGAGAGGAPTVFIFNGKDGSELKRFNAFAPEFTGGISVAAGDVTGDGKADIIVGAGAGPMGGHVRAFDGVSGADVSSFFAFQGFAGGVSVGSGDVDNDGRDDVLVGSGAGSASAHLKVYSGRTGKELKSFFAWNNYAGGCFVAAGDLDGDGRDDLIASSCTEAAHAKTFASDSGALLLSALTFANSTPFSTGFAQPSGGAPLVPEFDLAPAFDSLPLGDLTTSLATVTLLGQTTPGVTVTLGTRQTTAGPDGKFSFDNVPLTLGDNALTVTATAANGQSTPFTATVTRVPFEGQSLTEGAGLLMQVTSPVDLGQASGTRTLRFDIDATFDRSDTTAAAEDTFLVYLVDPNDPAKTLLDRGLPGTALFTLAGDKAEFRPGEVRFDGNTVEIDVTRAAGTQGTLVFQLLNSDGDRNTSVRISPVANTVDPDGAAGPMLSAVTLAGADGPALDLAPLTQTSDLTLLVENVRFDPTAKQYLADLRVRNDGSPVGRTVVAQFPGLPTGVELLSPSGTSANVPYINFRPAIPAGGLATGETSAAVGVAIASPDLTAFGLRAQFLVGGENRAPTLGPIGPLTTTPGDCLILPLATSDADGDMVTYTIAGNLPAGQLEGNELVFKPKPGQVGTYLFTFIASDGALQTTQNVTLNVVADPVTTTRLSGVILDTDSTPLANLPVEVGNVSGMTDAQGRFTLDLGSGTTLPGDALRVLGRAIPGNFPFIAEMLPLLLGHEVYMGVNNVICRPIYLPALNPGMPINPNADTTVTRELVAGEGMSEVFVAAGSLRDEQNNLFTGDLSITEVPVDLTPAALPTNLMPDLVVTIQPGEMVFGQPAPLTLPNRSNFPLGTVMDLWSINPVTGDFDDVGDGVVGADGRITTTTGGIRNSSWHFFAPPPPNPDDPGDDDNNKDDLCEECECTAPGGSEVELHTGALRENHDLVSYQSQGVSRSWSLHYNSLRADPRPIINFGYSNVQASDARRLMARLEVTRGDFTYQVPGAAPSTGLPGGEHFWRLTQNGNVRVALQADLSTLPSGIYEYGLTTGIVQFNNGQATGSTSRQSDEFIHVNSIGSIFGDGWGLGGLLQIVENPTGSLLLIDGANGEQLFGAPVGAGQTYDSPPGDFTRLEKLGNGTFRRTFTDGSVQTFGVDGWLTSERDRNGNTTTFEYSGPGKLTKITDPVGLVTDFRYTGARVTEIVDPAGRSTKLEYTNGRLTKITDPDDTNRVWEYDDRGLMTAETDKRGFRETEEYNFAGRVVKATLKDGSVMVYEPVQTQVLKPAELTMSPETAPAASPKTEATARFADGNGNVIETRLDQQGQAISSRDGAGRMGGVVRNAENLVFGSTDARGFTTDFDYDARGNVLSVTDRIGAISGGSLFVTGHDSDDHSNGEYQQAGLDFLTFGHEAIGSEIPVRAQVKIGYLGNNDASAAGEAESGYTDRTFIDLDNVNWATTAFSGQFDILMIGTGGDYVFSNGSAALNAEAARFAEFFNAGGGIYVNTDQGSIGQSFYNFLPTFGATQAALGGTGVYSVTAEGLLIGLTEAIVDADATHTEYKDVDTTVFRVFETHNTSGDPVAIGLFGGFIGGGGIGGVSRRFYTYDANFSQVTSETDGQGRRRLYDIDPANGNTRKSTQVFGAEDTPANGETDDLVSQYTYLASGQIDTMTDPLGRITDYDYDTRGQLVTVTYAKGTADEAVMRYEYDAAGNQIAMIDENNHRTEYEYDALNRLKKVTEADPDGNGPLTSPVTIMMYDLSGNQIEVTDAQGRTTKYAYDERDRVSRMTAPDPDGTGPRPAPVTGYTYDESGNLASMTDALGQVTTHRYDSRNRRVATTDPDGFVTLFSYDSDDNLSAVTDPTGNKTRFVYDSRNRLVNETDSLGKEIKYVYDASNNLVEKTDRNGRVTRFEYDSVNRLKTETWLVPNGTPLNVVNYEYDKASNLLMLSDNFSSLALTYDDRNRIKTVDNVSTPGAPRVVLTYAYDDIGNVTSVTDTINGQAGATTGYLYDALDRLTRVTQNGAGVGEKRIGLGYNPLGQLTALSRFADLAGTQAVASSTWSYDGQNRLTSIVHMHGGNPIASYQYTLDADERITRIISNDGTVDYSYDDRDQLTGADHTNAAIPDESYGYDGSGNRTQSHLHGTGYQTDPNTANRLKADGTFNYEYDNEGNLVKRTTIATNEVREFGWDYRNRLVRVTDKTSGGVITSESTYAYDALNRRLLKTVNGIPTHFVYDRADVLLDFVDADAAGPQAPALAVRYLHGTGIDQLLAEDRSGAVDWLLADHLGSTRDVINNAGVVLNHIVLDAYGRVLSQTNATMGTRYLFTGREFDPETGFHFFRARYYDPGVGRFLSQDPIRYTGGDPNFYAYVSNSPILYSDQTGFGVGHHYVPQSIFNPAGLPKEAYDVFNKGTTGPVPGGHGWSKEHKAYNEAVRDMWDKWTKNNNIDPSKMTKQQAEQFLNSVKNSDNPAVKKFIKEIEEKIAKEALEKAAKEGAEKGAKKLAKKGAQCLLKKVPIVGIGFFLYDYSQGGFGHAVDEATWPVSELWQ